MANPITIQAGTEIGSVSAEADDQFLFECFVDHPILSQIEDVNSPKMILLGGTGAGKTALLRMIEKKKEHVQSVEINELAMNHIANSDIIKFLESIDVRLDIFFQCLWRHVICMEFIRLRYAINDEEKSKTIFSAISLYFSKDHSRTKAIKYLSDWKDKFWITMDESIREVTEKFEDNISGELDAEIGKFRGNAGYGRTLGKEKKTQIQQRARKFVESDLISDLAHVINLLGSEYAKTGHDFYILIDKIDENWVDDSIRYRLIRALIEALKSMRRIKNLKIIVAMRNDVLEKVTQETKGEGFQAEKYEDYISRIRWNEDNLKSLINRRINLLYKRKYTRQNVLFEDIFTSKVDKQQPFPYMLERTQLRPRDIINFTNFAFAQSEGSVAVGQSALKAAEKTYSLNRRAAVEDEWSSVYPALGVLIDSLERKPETFSVSELTNQDYISSLVGKFLSHESPQSDSIWQPISQLYDDYREGSCFEVIRYILHRLNITGVVGLKIGKNDSYNWYSKSLKSVEPIQVGSDSRVRIHPMYFASLGTNARH